MSSLRYRPEIDGLRTIAVLPVIFFHLGFSAIKGGFYGVDVFFVISGFLITSLLLKDIQKGSFSLKEFWIRRVKRIMPALLFLVFIVLLVFPFLIFKGDIPFLISDAFSAIFSYANFHAYSSLGDYWGSKAESSTFLHAWSLSLEEQFYIFFPLFLYGLHRYQVSAFKGITAIIILSLILYYLGFQYNPDLTFYMLPSRAWELACGGLLATLPFATLKERLINYHGLAWIGLVFILLSYFLTSNGGISFVSLFPVLGTVLIILFSSSNIGLGKFLSSKPMVFIGKLSYSLYLWHWPIIVLLKEHLKFQISEFAAEILALFFTALFSLISYYLIETKTRTSSRGLQFVSFILIANLSLLTYYKYGLDTSYKSTFDQVVFYGLQYDITPTISEPSLENKSKRKGVIAPERSEKYKDAFKNGGLNFDVANNPPQILVLGDSHGAMWGKTLNQIAHEVDASIRFYTAVGSPPFFKLGVKKQKATKNFSQEERTAYANSVIQSINKWKPKYLVISCRWDSMDKGKWEDFEMLLSYVQRVGITVLIINQPPVVDVIGDRNTAQYLAFMGITPNAKSNFLPMLEADKVMYSNKVLADRVVKYKNVKVVDIYSDFCKQDSVLIKKSKKILYYDDDHLSYDGTELVHEKLKEYLNNSDREHLKPKIQQK